MNSEDRRLLEFGDPPIALRLEGDEPAWLPSVLRAVDVLLGLPTGWNSYGAPRIDPHAVEAALRLLLATMQPDTLAPSVVPTVRGGVQLEWHASGVDLEVEVTPSGHVSVAYEDDEGQEWEADPLVDLRPLKQALRSLVQ
jgi:hypothetical protein